VTIRSVSGMTKHPSGTTPDEAIVSVSDLRMRYGEREALAGLSFEVSRGELFALLGPNGAGKTSTVEILEGYRRRTGGQVRVLGTDPWQAGPGWRARIGVMLQEAGPEPDLTVAECLRLYGGYFPDPWPPGDLLELTGLGQQSGQRATQLSGGQRRKLDLALALTGRPQVLFLDEPTTGFDPAARRDAWDTIAALQDTGTTIILTTHYMDEAERLADRVVVVDHGSLVAEGTPAELTGTAGQLRFRAEPGLDTDSLLAALPPGSAAKESPAGYYVVEVHDRVDPQLVAAVTAWCAEHGVLAQSLQIESRTLEDVFLELTGRELRS